VLHHFHTPSRAGRTYLGRVVAPRQFTPYVMRGDNGWGVMRDDDDVPAIEKMRIEPTF